jgi:SulP family sulfate permease
MRSVRRREIPPRVEVFSITGPFFFGAAATFRDTIARVSGRPKVLIIRMRDVPALDSTGMRALRETVRGARKSGTAVLLSEVHMQPLVALTGSPTLAEIGQENVFGNLDDALVHARALVSATRVTPEHVTGRSP